VNESHQIHNLGIGQIESGHPLVGSSIANHNTNGFAFLIGADKPGSCQIGPRLAAASILAMAKGAILEK
jgi:hypothetical protein